MFENINEMYPDQKFQNKGKSKKSAYLLLIGLSTLSALVILSLWLIMRTYHDYGSLAGLAWLAGILAGQWLLVIPATLIVFSLYMGLSHPKKLYKINLLVRIGIPLLFNILAASSFFISMIALHWYGSISGFLLSLNFTVTIREESIIPTEDSAFFPYIYHAVLRTENNTGQEITARFSLGDYRTKTYQPSYGPGSFDELGYQFDKDALGSRIPSGVSDIIIDIEIDKDVLSTFCSDDRLAKPLHLLYSLGGHEQYNGFVLVDKSINKRLQELACDATP